MARIRTIKPEFFRHEALQQLEIEHANLYPMLVFCGLWGHCDRVGTFEWRPKQLKLDILPFLAFDMVETLNLLTRANLIHTWEAQGKHWGNIPTFPDHQRITGKEASAALRYPQAPVFSSNRSSKPVLEAVETSKGNIGEAPRCVTESQEGKGTRKGREQERTSDPDCFPSDSPAVPRETVSGQRVMEFVEGKIRAVYPTRGYTGQDWLMAQKQIHAILEAGMSTEADLLRLTGEYARQCVANQITDTRFVMNPAKFYDRVTGHWAGPFVIPRQATQGKPETNMERIIRLNAPGASSEAIEGEVLRG